MKKFIQSILIMAGLVLSTRTSNAYTNYGMTSVNGTSYRLEPHAYLLYANLSYANLTSADLNHVYLAYANLRYVNLTDANLSYANLTGTNLSYANLTGTNLSYANLSYVNLRYAIVSYDNWSDFYNNSSAGGLASNYAYAGTLTYVGRSAVPEPSTYGLMLGGLALAAIAIHRRKKTA